MGAQLFTQRVNPVKLDSRIRVDPLFGGVTRKLKRPAKSEQELSALVLLIRVGRN